MARRAGFATVRVEHPSLYEYAKRARLAKPDLEMFKGSGLSDADRSQGLTHVALCYD
jgi:hypothetical protein